MGQNAREKMQNIFCVSVTFSGLVALFFTAVFALMGALDLTGFLTRDDVVRPLLNQYLLGQAIGILPLVLGNQLAAFLFLENRSRLTVIGSLANIAVSTALNLLFVLKLQMGAFGLALSNALGSGPPCWSRPALCFRGLPLSLPPAGHALEGMRCDPAHQGRLRPL